MLTRANVREGQEAFFLVRGQELDFIEEWERN
jgi:hypothetical protein